MTKKKEQVLLAALELFALKGFHATSTKEIALRAEVSEGLIFRHFQHKKGLLIALKNMAIEKIEKATHHILLEKEGRKVIEAFIRMPFEVTKDQYPFWKLQYKLKWEEDYEKGDELLPIFEKLNTAFQSLGFDQPAMEAGLLVQWMETIVVSLIRNELPEAEQYRSFLLQKYGV